MLYVYARDLPRVNYSETGGVAVARCVIVLPRRRRRRRRYNVIIAPRTIMYSRTHTRNMPTRFFPQQTRYVKAYFSPATASAVDAASPSGFNHVNAAHAAHDPTTE